MNNGDIINTFAATYIIFDKRNFKNKFFENFFDTQSSFMIPTTSLFYSYYNSNYIFMGYNYFLLLFRSKIKKNFKITKKTAQQQTR